MNILIIDGQGGKLGAQIVKTVTETYPEAVVTSVGTNSVATAAMLRGGAHHAATGENAVIVACRKADVIIGPIAIVIADSLLGEVTPAMAVAVGQAGAARILLPVSKCENLVAGVRDVPTAELLSDTIKKLAAFAGK